MERLQIIGLYIRIALNLTWLFIVYMIARTIKTPFFNLEIDPFGSWKLFDDQVERDTSIVVFLALGLTGFYFLSFWWFLIIIGVFLMNFIAFLVWMFTRSRKNDTDTGTEIELIKQKFKFWKK